MVRIERVAKNVAAFPHVVLPQLFAARLHVVATLTQTRKLIERRVWIAAGIDRRSMVDGRRRLDVANLQAGLAQRVRAQLGPP